MDRDNIVVASKPSPPKPDATTAEQRSRAPAISRAMSQQRGDLSNQSTPQKFVHLVGCRDPRARASAAGIINTVGWGGGAIGPLAVGWFAKHGKYGSEMQNMSHAISGAAAIYVVGAVLLILAAFGSANRDTGVWKSS